MAPVVQACWRLGQRTGKPFIQQFFLRALGVELHYMGGARGMASVTLKMQGLLLANNTAPG